MGRSEYKGWISEKNEEAEARRKREACMVDKIRYGVSVLLV
jgi:hypothetical protein